MVLPFKPQKVIPYNRHLPYYSKLDDEAVSALSEIKFNLARAVYFQELTPGILVWCNRLDNYLRMYGRNFSKEDHLHFVKLLYELMIIPRLEPQFVKGFATVLHKLLKKQDLLTREDLQLDWRPLYELVKSVRYSKEAKLGLKFYPSRFSETINLVIKVARTYFSVESTKEMLIEWRPLLCPFDAVKANAAYYFSHFLPTRISHKYHANGFRMWFEELFSYWLHCTKNIPSVCEEYSKLFMRLAECNVGHINWNKKIPEIFNHFLSNLELPINGQASSYSKVSANVYAKWFVYMIGGEESLLVDNLEKLFKSLESFYHPSNHGRFSMSLLGFLHAFTDHFIQRLHLERYRKKSWLTEIHPDYKITDREIERIVIMLKDISLMSIYSKSGSIHAASTLQNLSLLRSDLILPELIEKTSEALETLVEPHQVTATLTCITSVARMLTSGGEGKFPEAPNHILPLLYLVLPGIDPNDFRKSMAAFTLISAMVGVIPLVDCMPAIESGIEMSEVERELCIASAQFEDFVLQFIDRCFVLIENSTAEEIAEKDNASMRNSLNAQEGMLGMGLVSTVQIVLNQCSPKIFQAVLDSMFSFVSTRVLEVNVAGKMVSDMCRSAAKACPEMTLKKFLPFVCSRVTSLATVEGVQEEEHVDGELLWYLEILSEIVQCDGKVILPHRGILKETIRLTLHMKCKKAYSRSGKLLKSILCSCSEVYPLEWYSQHTGFTKSPTEHFYIRDWGKTGDLKDLNMKWHIPDQNELEFINELLRDFLLYELDVSKCYINGDSMTRDELHQHLHIIAFMTYGCGNVLPSLTGKKVEGLSPFTMVSNNRRMLITNCGDINNFQVCITRNEIAMEVHKLYEYLLQKNEDDTKAFRIISKIFNCLLRHHGVNANEFNFRWKNATAVKKALSNKLHGNKLHIRTILVERVRLQHDLRVLDRYSSPFTDIEQIIVGDLLKLSLSDYAEVRMESQQNLFSALEMYDYSARYILPKLLHNIDENSNVSHETLKGTLYILQYSRVTYLISHYWDMMIKAWPSIINAGHSEKPSIIMLLHKLLIRLTSNYDSLGLDRKVSDSCIDISKAILQSTHPTPCSGSTDISKSDNLMPCKELVDESIQRRDDNNAENRRLYIELVGKLTSILIDKDLHWRTLETCMKLFVLLLDDQTKLPENAVQVFSSMLVHDSRVLRNDAVKAVVGILHQHKPKFDKKNVDYKALGLDCLDENLLSLSPGEARNDIQVLQYNRDKKPHSQDDFDELLLIEKTHVGYQTWPKEWTAYCNNTSMYKKTISELPKEGQIVLEKMSSNEFREKFIKFLSIENKKGEDRFSLRNYQFFKGIFRNFGNQNNLMEKFLVILQDLLKENTESCHRCAAEIMAGMIRGSKNWSFDDKVIMWKQLCAMLKEVLTSKIIPEMVRDWAVALITSTESLDPNRFFDLYELLQDHPLSGQGGAFGDATRLFLLQNTVAQQEWRVASINNNMLDYLMSHLCHPFKNVRDQIGSLLSYIFMYDLKYGAFTPTLSPMVSSFFKEIKPKLEEISKNALIAAGDFVSDEGTGMEVDHVSHKNEDDEKKTKDCFAKTILVFLLNLSHHSMQPITKEIFEILPLLIPLESRDDDPEIVQLCKRTFPMVASKQIPSDIIDVALSSILQVCRSTSWNCRKTALNYLKIMLFNNLFTCDSKSVKSDIQTIIMERLQDDQLEVREIASSICSGLIHYGYISMDDNLLKCFLKMSERKIKKKRGGVDLSPDDHKANTKASRIKHGGVLGLSACILAFPYQVPEWMPEILLRLGDYLHEAPQIVASVKKTLSEFRRTHHDNWHMHRQKFTGDQLSILTDLIVSPSYYA